jgi:hypothetical protein
VSGFRQLLKTFNVNRTKGGENVMKIYETLVGIFMGNLTELEAKESFLQKGSRSFAVIRSKEIKP